MQRMKSCVGAVLIVACIPNLARTLAQDSVTVRRGDGRIVHREGEIQSYSSSELKLTLESGRKTTIPAQRVIDLQPADTPLLREAREAFAAQDDQRALDLYRRAYANATRPWVKAWLVSRSVVCLHNLGRHHEAAKNFLALEAQAGDELTPYIEVVPLAWQSGELPRRLRSDAKTWLTRFDRPLVQLVAASWLLSGPEGATAKRKLRDLMRHPHPVVADLARAQRWRANVVNVTQSELATWQTVVDRLPHGLRAGPTFLTGQAWGQLAKPDRAALAYLRVSFVYNQDRPLAAACLYAAAHELGRSGHAREARRLATELVQRYPASPWVAPARDAWMSLSETE